jgi:Na+/H+ antiporter NhaD/arsenite permease-like protein
MIVSMILLLILFVAMLILIAKDLMDRAALVFICAAIAFLILIIVDQAPPTVIIDFLFGTTEDEFLNFHTVLLIFGVMIISTICNFNGFFQFIAFQMIKLTKGEPKKVLIICAGMAFLISSILADSITVIIVIPLTITICKAIKMNPVPYLIIEAIYIKLGATVLPISSIPSIIITSSQGISFAEYFTTAGLISIAIAIFSLTVYYFIFKKKLPVQEVEGLDIFVKLNPWIFVKDRRMMTISAVTFLIVIIGLVMVPPTILRMDAIVCFGAAFLLVVNYKKSQEILKLIDFNLLLYLFGIFTISGALQYSGFIDYIGGFLSSLGITDTGLAFIALLWIGAIASAFIDNIPITQLLLSLINVLMGAKGTPTAKMGSLGLAVGVIWGDNLAPFGDSILTLNVAKANKVEIPPKELFKIGFPLTILQLSTVSIAVIVIFNPLIGLSILSVIIGIIVVFYLYKKGFFEKFNKKQININRDLPTST